MKCVAFVIICIYFSLQLIAPSDAFTSCGVPRQAVAHRKTTHHPLFRELISDDDQDLRPDVSVIVKQEGLESFLQADDRLCVIKLYAPFCKACKAFGVKFRKLALERGDRVNAAGDVVHPGIARFGEIEYSANIKLCKYLKVKKFPTVLMYLNEERVGEIDCKHVSIENLVSEMDQAVETIKR